MHTRSAIAVYVAACLVLFLAGPSGALAVSASRAPYTRVDPASKREITPDPNAIWLENEYLKVAILTTVSPFLGSNPGQVVSLVYKPARQELCNPMTLQGYWQDRGVPGRCTEGKGEIIAQSDANAQARVTYLSAGEQNGRKIALRHTKTYTLLKGASYLLVQWKQENVGGEPVLYNPWIKHVGGCSATLLNGPPKIVMPGGPTTLAWNFKPTVNWIARLSGERDSEKVPMVVSLTDYRRIFRQCAWQKPPRYTLETTLTRLDLKPGESSELPSVLLVTPNLGNVTYAAPELAAALAVDGEIKAGQPATLTLEIAAGFDLGEKRLEGQIVTHAGRTAASVPNQQVWLQVGKISRVTYKFTPPGDGVYFLNLTVFDRQRPLRLGEVVKSQKTYITLPIVVGPAPPVVVRNWESEDKGFPPRKGRRLAPWRTLLNGPSLQACQVQVPQRVFPEDRLTFEAQTRPAFVRLAAGEYECLQFLVAVPAPQDPMALTATVSPLVDDGGVALESAVLHEQMYLTTEIPSAYMDFPVGQWPDPLFETDWATRIPNAPIVKQNIDHIRKSRRRVYWLTIRAQADAKGGTYKGTIKLALAGRPAGTFPVEVRANSFSLPRRATLRCATGMVGWRGSRPENWRILGFPEAEVKAITRNAMDSYRRLILQYGWTPTMWFGGAKTWEEYKDVGRGPSVFSSGANKADEAWLERNGLLRYAFTYAPFDEHPDGKVPAVVEWAEKWKAANKIPILDCYYGRNVEPLFGLVDIWLGQDPRGGAWGNPTPPLGWGHKAIERKKAGDSFFACNASLIWHIEFDPAVGRSAFWDDFAAGVDGHYVYSTCRWTDDVYKKNWTTGNYMGCVVYPGPHGITTSVRLETLRDGVEDYDYLALLRQAVAAAKAKGTHAAAVKEAETILGDPKLAARAKTVEDIHAMRNKIADLLEALSVENAK